MWKSGPRTHKRAYLYLWSHKHYTIQLTISNILLPYRLTLQIVVGGPNAFEALAIVCNDFKLIASPKTHHVATSAFSFPLRPPSFFLCLVLSPPVDSLGLFPFLPMFLVSPRALPHPTTSHLRLNFHQHILSSEPLVLHPLHASLLQTSSPLLSLNSLIFRPPSTPVPILLHRGCHCSLPSLFLELPCWVCPITTCCTTQPYPLPIPLIIILCSPDVFCLLFFSRPLSQWQLLLFWRGRVQLAVNNRPWSLLETTPVANQGYQTELPIIRWFTHISHDIFTAICKWLSGLFAASLKCLSSSLSIKTNERLSKTWGF